MKKNRKLTAKEVALLICFTALYTYLCFAPAFPIVGLQGGTIPLAAVTAPIIGILLGPSLGMLSTLLGGIAGLFFAPTFFPPSFASGIVTAVFAGMLYANKRIICTITYFSLLFFFGFYPFIGPAWLYPLFMWFQITGLLILVSPLQSTVFKKMKNSENILKLSSALFIVCLISTLAGQIAGSLVFELISYPIFIENIDYWTGWWQLLTWLYPIERIIIALSATITGVFLYRILSGANLISLKKHLEL